VAREDRGNTNLKTLGSTCEVFTSQKIDEIHGAESQDDHLTFGKEKPRSVVIDTINKAAKTILDHNEAHKAWTVADYPEIPGILNKINRPGHYIAEAVRHDFLKKFK